MNKESKSGKKKSKEEGSRVLDHFFLLYYWQTKVNIMFKLEMESGNYYTAERRNKVCSEDEVKTESVSARKRATQRPRATRLCLLFLQTRRVTEVSDTDTHLVPC